MSDRYMALPLGAVLKELNTWTTINTGGPPALGATIQNDGSGEFVWSIVTGSFMAFEEASLMLTESGEVVITES